MAAPIHKRMTVDAFVAWCDAQPDECRYELVHGEIVAMSPERTGHAKKKLAAVNALMAIPTGTTFPGQVHVSAVVAGGITPVTTVISVGYASEAEMETWVASRNASAGWATYIEASGNVSEFLGTSLARTVKRWGGATLSELTD